jgi:hypothetical protein
MTTIASYSNTDKAQKAYDTLLAAGIDKSHMSIASKEPEKTSQQMNADVQSGSDVAKDVTSGTTTGALSGAAVGFLAGVAALTIPVFGPLLISGPLALALGGSALAANTAVGAAVGGLGGLASGLIKAGANESDAQEIESHLMSGGVIIALKNDDLDVHLTALKDTNPDSLVTLND